MKNYYYLDFDDEFLNPGVLSNLSNTSDKWQTIALKKHDLTHRCIDYLNTLRIGSHLYPLLFVGKPESGTVIHIDGNNTKTNCWAINYVVNGENSSMTWYDKKETVDVTESILSTGTAYKVFKESDVIEIDRTTLKRRAVLVRTDIPHRIYNNGPLIRYCTSIRSSYPVLNTWEDAVSYYSSHIVES